MRYGLVSSFLTYRASAVGDFSLHPTHWQGSCSPAPLRELFTAGVAAAAVAVTEAVDAAVTCETTWAAVSLTTGAGAGAVCGGDV